MRIYVYIYIYIYICIYMYIRTYIYLEYLNTYIYRGGEVESMLCV